MPGAMPPRVTIMPNYAELCYYAEYAAPMQLCRFIMLASRGMPNLRDENTLYDLYTLDTIRRPAIYCTLRLNVLCPRSS
jgi:hypothetical protein